MATGISLRSRLLAVVIITFLALASLFAVLLSNERQQLLNDRKEKVRNLVEVAHSSVSSFEKQVQQGAMSEDDAKRAALGVLRTMRYDENEYFWVNDFTPTTVMHPIRPEHEGKPASAVKDPTGKQLFVAFVNAAKSASGAGFVDYIWPKPGSDDPEPKIAYVKTFAPWGWIIGTGIYVDDVDALFRQQALRFLAWGCAIGGLITLVLLLVGHNIIRTLGGEPAYAAAITRRIAAGDLAGEVKCASGDDSSLLAGMKEMQNNLRTMIREIVDGAENLATASDQLLGASESVSESAIGQSEAASAMAAAVEEMTVSIDQIAQNAREAHGISTSSGEASEAGTRIIENAALEMRRIAGAVQSSSKTIEELGQQAEEITSIVNTIREIADQTNLLALNAAIEAARAGEQGRGFAVVADEVRKLAERTSLSTAEIAGMVDKIQGGTRNAVASMQSGVAQADQGVKLANEAGTSIVSICDGARRVSEVVNDISSAIHEQSAASGEISRNVERIAQMSEEGARAVHQTTAAARHLQELSARLHKSVGRFKAI